MKATFLKLYFQAQSQNSKLRNTLASLSFLFIHTFSCITNTSGNVEHKSKIGFFSNADEIYNHINNYNSPKGIVPDTLYQNLSKNDAFLFLNSKYTNEFFIFDEGHILILFDIEPFFYIEIKSPLFYLHALNEYKQFENLILGKSKLQGSSSFLKKISQYQFELYFGPEEMGFGTGDDNNSRIYYKNANSKPRYDLWRLLEAANDVEVYTSFFTDEKLLKEFLEHESQNKYRRIFLSNFEIQENFPKLASYISKPNLSFFYGKNLNLTPSLIDGENLNYLDLNSLTKNFIFILSINPGSGMPQNTTISTPPKNFIDYKNSLGLLIRGDDLSLFYKALLEYIYSQSRPLPTPTSLYIKKQVLITEFANNINKNTENDYVILYNPNPLPISLGGLYIGRDANCDLNNGWSEYSPLPLKIIAPYSYFLLTKKSNLSLSADGYWEGNLSKSYCIVISHFEIPPPSLTDGSNFASTDAKLLENWGILDAISFKDLSEGKIYKRKGVCGEELIEEHSLGNFNLLSETESLTYIKESQGPRTSASPPCNFNL